MLDVVGDDDSGPLLAALTKLGNALGNPNLLEIRLGEASEETMAALRRAITEHRQVRIDYYSYGRDQRSERTIEPARFFSDEGQWYVAGYCHLAGADRIFRIDRIRKLTVLDTTFTPSAGGRGLQLLDPTAALPRVSLELAPDARWVLEQYPHDDARACENGWTRVTLPIAAAAWLERLLVRLGPLARIVDAPNDLGIDLRTAAARRILDRYGF
jgi:proteasome accessory factor C